jgi:hypothetical protein
MSELLFNFSKSNSLADPRIRPLQKCSKKSPYFKGKLWCSKCDGYNRRRMQRGSEPTGLKIWLRRSKRHVIKMKLSPKPNQVGLAGSPLALAGWLKRCSFVRMGMMKMKRIYCLSKLTGTLRLFLKISRRLFANITSSTPNAILNFGRTHFFPFVTLPVNKKNQFCLWFFKITSLKLSG